MTERENTDRDALIAELNAMCGYMLNAAIGLGSGGTKKSAINTLNAGINRAEAFLAKASHIQKGGA